MAEGALERTDVKVKIVWGLYILSLATGGLLSLVGVILAYVWRGSPADGPLATHFSKQIKVFWITLVLTVIGAVLTLVLIGYLVLLAAGIYMLVMSIIGIVRAFDGKPWP